MLHRSLICVRSTPYTTLHTPPGAVPPATIALSFHSSAMTSALSKDVYFRFLYASEPDFQRLALHDADFRAMSVFSSFFLSSFRIQR